MKFEMDIRSFEEISQKRQKVFCKGYIPLLEGSPTMLYAGGGTGKSYASIRIAIEYALETGKKAALWLTEDTPGENRFRYEAICNEFYPTKKEEIKALVMAINSPPARFTKLDRGNAVLTEDFWRTRLALNEYGMVVIDPLIQFNGGDENSNSHAGVLMGAIKTWAQEENKSIILIHHVTINDGNVKVRGAGEWGNGCRAVYLVGRPSAGMPESFLKFTLTKNNGVAWCFKNDAGELSRELEIFPPWKKSQETNEIVLPFISLANHNRANDPKGYKKIDVYFRDLHNYVIGDCAYSPYSFKGGYRKGENNEGGATVISLDFDSGLTIEAAKKVFFKYESLIVTTRSHQKQKGDEQACDRFRVLLNLKSPLDIPVNEYPIFLDYLYGILKHVDPSTKDLARFYFASPIDAQWWYSDSSMKFDWAKVYEDMKRAKALEKISQHLEGYRQKKETTEYAGEPQNTMPVDTLFETIAGTATFGQLRQMLTVGEKITCRCADNIDHGGLGASHHSAFVKKDSNGNVFYSCSGGRCASVGTLWCANWKE